MLHALADGETDPAALATSATTKPSELLRIASVSWSG